MKYDTILFDFDGTIADSEKIMFEALNAIAGEFGFQPVMPEEFPSLRQLSARAFVAERLRIPLWRVRKLLRLEKKTKAEYAKRSTGIRMFSGMPDVLRALRENGVDIGIVTSAPREVVERALRENEVAVDFVRAGVGTFGKARAIRGALRERRIGAHALYVGDELRDAEACKKAGIAMLGVSWGLNDAAALRAAGVEVAATPRELLAMLTGMN
jgi:phosphoglycolate phosphatase